MGRMEWAYPLELETDPEMVQESAQPSARGWVPESEMELGLGKDQQLVRWLEPEWEVAREQPHKPQLPFPLG